MAQPTHEPPRVCTITRGFDLLLAGWLVFSGSNDQALRALFYHHLARNVASPHKTFKYSNH